MILGSILSEILDIGLSRYDMIVVFSWFLQQHYIQFNDLIFWTSPHDSFHDWLMIIYPKMLLYQKVILLILLQ